MSTRTREYHDIRPAELATVANDLDCRFWESVREDQELTREAFPDRASSVVGNDLFNTLFHFRPKMRPDAPERRRGEMLTKLMQSSEWMRLHEATMGDDMLAAAGAIKMRQEIAKDPAAEEVMEQVEQLERLQEKLESLEALHQENPDAKGIEEQVTEVKAELGEVEQTVDQQLANRDTAVALRQASKAAARELENAVELASGWGNTQGTLEQFLFDPEISNYLRGDKIRRILDIAGRMRAVISAERAKRPRPGPQERKLRTGDELEKVVASELAFLADEDLEDIFFRRYTERALLQTEREEKPRLGKGPFIVCTDESASMKGVPEEWAKALTFALCQQARREKRGFGAIAFGAEDQIRPVFQPEPPEFMEWINECFMAGGTDFDTPMVKAVEMIDLGLAEADIIMITDGACQPGPFLQQAFPDIKKNLGIKAIGIQVGSGNLDGMKPFCDAIFRLDVTRGADGLEAVIAEMK